MGRRGRSIVSDQGNILFVTTTVMNFGRVFSCDEVYYSILLDSLKYVLIEHRATLFAFVFMPSHIHLIVGLPVGEHISDMMRDFKKFTSTKIRQQLERDSQTMWVERLHSNAWGKKRQVFKLWMDRFDDVVVYTEEIMRIKVDYIHENPVRAGLVQRPEDWKFSSARNYSYDDHSLIYVATDWKMNE
ncbi:MAG: transposase [Bacteroidota bacterium]